MIHSPPGVWLSTASRIDAGTNAFLRYTDAHAAAAIAIVRGDVHVTLLFLEFHAYANSINLCRTRETMDARARAAASRVDARALETSRALARALRPRRPSTRGFCSSFARARARSVDDANCARVRRRPRALASESSSFDIE